ncbi:MAG: hypothetical protein WCO60_17815 [Verrucomicrobiota bacterium]
MIDTLVDPKPDVLSAQAPVLVRIDHPAPWRHTFDTMDAVLRHPENSRSSDLLVNGAQARLL